jgi:hypothetical protein
VDVVGVENIGTCDYENMLVGSKAEVMVLGNIGDLED